MISNKPEIFLSYKRTNTEFVDRLEVDLTVRDLDPWLDRQDLRSRGGQRWAQELRQAIERCHVLVLIATPDAIASEYVRAEYKYARQIGRPIIPLLYQPCNDGIPSELKDLPWINFIGESQYSDGLDQLVLALMSVPIVEFNGQHYGALFTGKDEDKPELVSLPYVRSFLERQSLVDLDELKGLPDELKREKFSELDRLYNESLLFRSKGNLERAVFLWERILDYDPAFLKFDSKLYERLVSFQEFIRNQLPKLKEDVVPRRVQNLFQIAEDARRGSMWGRQIAALNAIVAMNYAGLQGNPVLQVQEALRLAQHHKQHEWIYKKAQEFVTLNELETAAMQLDMLWREAPFYGDPQELAARVNLPPRNNEFEEKIRKEGEREKIRQEREEQTERLRKEAEQAAKAAFKGAQDRFSKWMKSKNDN